jgi:hypothetical protein
MKAKQNFSLPLSIAVCVNAQRLPFLFAEGSTHGAAAVALDQN